MIFRDILRFCLPSSLLKNSFGFLTYRRDDLIARHWLSIAVQTGMDRRRSRDRPCKTASQTRIDPWRDGDRRRRSEKKRRKKKKTATREESVLYWDEERERSSQIGLPSGRAGRTRKFALCEGPSSRLEVSWWQRKGLYCRNVASVSSFSFLVFVGDTRESPEDLRFQSAGCPLPPSVNHPTYTRRHIYMYTYVEQSSTRRRLPCYSRETTGAFFDEEYACDLHSYLTPQNHAYTYLCIYIRIQTYASLGWGQSVLFLPGTGHLPEASVHPTTSKRRSRKKERERETGRFTETLATRPLGMRVH